MQNSVLMERRVRGNLLARCGVGEKLEMTSKTYLSLCKEGAEILTDNCQDTIFGGFAPQSQTAEVLSKALGSRTVLSGSISRGKNDPSQSLQMMERALMTPDELKSIPKREFVVMKTGTHPMRTRLRLFLEWGITFGEPYQMPEQAGCQKGGIRQETATDAGYHKEKAWDYSARESGQGPERL